MQKTNQSRKWLIAVAICIFLVMLMGNMFTDRILDDYSYGFNFADRTKRITNVWDIFGSMYAHAFTGNGRLVAHAFAQLFLMLPGIVFDIVNSLMFVLQTYLIYRFAKGSKLTSSLSNVTLFLWSFMGAWLFELFFGQVNFWLAGSCNYLWNNVLAFAFILPYYDKVLSDKDLTGWIKIGLFLVMSFLMGAWSESASAAAIFISFFLACYAKFILHYKLRPYHYAALAVAFAGYITIFLAPASKGRAGSMSLRSLVRAAGDAYEMLYAMRALVFVLVCLFVIAFFVNASRKIVVSAAILTAGGLFAEFLMIFALYNPERRVAFTCVLFTAACVMLLAEILRGPSYKVMVFCVSACALLMTFHTVMYGLHDIASCYSKVTDNRARIEESLENGTKEALLRDIVGRTKYSVYYETSFLTDDPAHWANRGMARHYGLDSVELEPAKK